MDRVFSALCGNRLWEKNHGLKNKRFATEKRRVKRETQKRIKSKGKSKNKRWLKAKAKNSLTIDVY